MSAVVRAVRVMLVVWASLVLWAAPAGAQSCQVDSDCPGRSVCVAARCQGARRAALIYYHQPGPTGHRVVAPFYFHFWEPDARTRLVLPFFFERSQGGAAPLHDLIIPPLLYQRLEEPGSTSHRVWPFFFYSRSTRPGAEGGTMGLLPLFFYNARGDRRVLVLPALGTVDVRERDEAFGLYGLLGYRRQRGDSVAAGIFPIFFHHHDSEHHANVAPPLFIEGGSRGHRFGGLLPFFFLSRRTDSIAVALPFLLTGYGRDDARGSSTTVVGPFYHARRREDRYGGLLPLFAWHRGATELTVALPFLLSGYGRDEHRGTSTTVVGPFYHARREERRDVGLVPLFFWHRSATRLTVALPFLLSGYGRDEARGKSTTVVGPFYHAVRREERYAGLAPLFFWHREPTKWTLALPLLLSGYGRDDAAGTSTTVVGPFYHARRGEARDAGLVPLFFWHREPTKRTLALPLLLSGYGRDAAGTSTLVVGPFYRAVRREDQYAGLLPLFAWHRGATMRVLALPLFLSGYGRDDATGSSTTVVGPFYHAVRREEHYTGLVPLFFWQRNPTTRTLLLPLLLSGYGRDDAEGASTTVVGPFYHARRRDDRYAGLVPLFFWQRGVTTRTLALPLLLSGYGRDDADGSSTTVVGPFYRAARREERYTGLAPLFFWHRSPTARTLVLPLLLTGYSRNDAAGTSTTVVGPFYRARDADQRYLGLLPLFASYKSPTARMLALPLLLTWFGSDDAERSSTTVVGPFYHARRGGERYTGFLPLFLHHAGPRETTVVLPPLLTYVRRAPGQLGLVVFPLLFHGHSETRSTTVLFPLFYHLRRPESRATALLPLFAYHRGGGVTTLALPFLLTGARLADNGERTVISFPLFFHRETAQSGSTVVFPFLYLLRRPGYRAAVFFPLGATWETARGRSTLVLNLFTFRGAARDAGTWAVRFWPLLHVAHRPRPQDLEWTFLEGFLGYQRLGRYRTLRLLWIPIPLRDAE